MSADAYEPFDFANRRPIGPSPEEIAEMLRVVGVLSLDALIDETVPKDIRLGKALGFDRPLSERGALDRLRETAKTSLNPPRRSHCAGRAPEGGDHGSRRPSIRRSSDRFPCLHFWHGRARCRLARAGDADQS